MADVSSVLPTKDLADGTDGAAAPPVAIAIGGIDGSGNLQALLSDTAGILNTIKTARGSGVEGALTVGTSAVELKVGGSALAKRVNCTLYNNSNVVIYWGYTSSVTASSGTPINKNDFFSWDVSDGRSVYLIAGTASNNTRITEVASS